MTNIPKPNWKAAFLGRCPACGVGKLFGGIIKVNNSCPSCGTDLKNYETADGPAFFAISIIGALAGLGVGLLEVIFEPPFWVHLVVWTPFIFIGSFIVIRISKGLMIAHQMDLKNKKRHGE